MRSLTDLKPELEDYLSSVFGRKTAILGLEQVFGGASRQTWRIRVTDSSGEKRLIMRRTQPSALIETEQAVEAGAMQAFAATEVPVPEVLATGFAGSAEAGRLDAPFMLVGELPGAASSPFDVDPYGDARTKMGEQFWSYLGQIAGDRKAARAFADFSPACSPKDCWKLELQKWHEVIRADSLGPEPILEAALRWLYANPPPAPKALVPVHGDYRSGNFLHLDGRITAVLDWEMAHLGDPHEDIAWAATPLWSQHDPDCPAALIPKAEGMELWARQSGLFIDPVALHWWEVFAAVKGMAIWISAGHEFASSANEEPVNLLSSWLCSDIHLQTLISLLAPAGTPGAQSVV